MQFNNSTLSSAAMHCSACPYTGACELLVDTVQNLWPSRKASLIGVTPLTRVCYRDRSYAIAISWSTTCIVKSGPQI